MTAPITTRTLQAAIESQRRAEAARRWQLALHPSPQPVVAARRDIPAARRSR